VDKSSCCGPYKRRGESQRPWTSRSEHTESRALTKAPWYNMI
ncbi:hypothetical protein LEMLEM_LOCUS24992, partial [Lemmus lemmus]